MPSQTMASATEPQRILIMQLRDRTGAIERVVSLLRRRCGASSIATMQVTPTEEAKTQRVTIALRAGKTSIEQVVMHLRKLEDVQSAVALPVNGGGESDAVVRELALIRVACDAQTRREIVDLAHIFAARAVEVSDQTITLEVSGASDTIEGLLRLLRPFGVREVARTGKVVMPREANEGAYEEIAEEAALRTTG